jgi:hypothetical protein
MNNLDRAEHERLATGAEFALHRYTVDDLQKNILLRFNEVFRDLRSESRESQWNLLSLKFVGRVEAYATGLFRNSFTTTPELQTEVVSALQNIAAGPDPLRWRAIGEPPEVQWRAQFDQRDLASSQYTAVLELHFIPIGTVESLPVGRLDSIAKAFAAVGREFGIFEHEHPLNVGKDGSAAWAAVTPAALLRDRPAIVGLRLTRNRRLSVWKELPWDSMGPLLDPEDLRRQMTDMVRLAAATGVLVGDETAPVAGIESIESLVQGSLVDLGRRTSAQYLWTGRPHVRTDIEDAIPTASLPAGASEIADELVARLLVKLR